MITLEYVAVDKLVTLTFTNRKKFDFWYQFAMAHPSINSVLVY